jgi:hypothetical protein
LFCLLSHYDQAACDCENECTKKLTVPPKTLELNQIDLEGNEWNFDFFDQPSDQPVDAGILGMFQLTESESKPPAPSGGCSAGSCCGDGSVTAAPAS